jgi:hypothetical protein
VTELARALEPNLCPRPRKETNFACRLLRAALQRANAADKNVKMQVLRLAWKMLKAFDGVQMDEGFSVFIRDRIILMMRSGIAEQRALAVEVFAFVAVLEDDEETVEALRCALDDSNADVRLQVLKLLEHTAGDWEALAADVAYCARQDSEASVRRLAFQALSVAKAKEWLSDAMVLDLALAGARDAESSVRDACANMLMRRWRGTDVAAEIERLTPRDKGEQDVVIAALLQGGLSLPVKYFREKIDALTPVAARLWLEYLNRSSPETREQLLPSVAAYAAALDYYATQGDQFVTLCAMLSVYDEALFEGHREQLSEILRKVILEGDEPASESVLEASLGALKVLHPETRDWVHVCLEIVVDLIDEDVREPDQLRWSSALQVAHNVLQDPRVKLTQAGMQELLHNVLLRGIASEAAPVRALAVRALGCLCTSSFEHARTYMLLFATVLNKDLVEVQVEATKVLLDCCFLYGASLVPALTPEALNELAEGPQCDDEPHPVLARVLSPLDVRNANHELQEIASLGLAKMLLHGRLQSYSMLGRAISKAAEGFPLMELFTREFAQRAPKVCLPVLRQALPRAVLRLRGKQQGVALRNLAKNWNVPWDSLAAQALLGGADPIAVASMSPTGAASEALREAVVTRFASEKSSVLKDALLQWASDRDIVIPGASSIKKGRRKKVPKNAPAGGEEEDGSSFASPAPKKRASTTPKSAGATTAAKKRSKTSEAGAALPAPTTPVVMTPEMARLKKINHDLDAFKLDEEVGSSASTVVKRPRPDVLLDEPARHHQDEIVQLREKMAKVACEPTDASSDALRHRPMARDSEETPLRGAAVHVLLSGFASDQRSKLQEIVQSLGGSVSESAAFSQRVSHVVVKQLRDNTSSKVLAGALKGCWIVSHEWLAECALRKMFVDEQPFGTRFSRASRPVFRKRIFFSPSFVEERKQDASLQISHIEALLLTPYLGGGVRCDDYSKADVILTSSAEKPTLKIKLGQKAFSFADLTEAILTQ